MSKYKCIGCYNFCQLESSVEPDRCIVDGSTNESRWRDDDEDRINHYITLPPPEQDPEIDWKKATGMAMDMIDEARLNCRRCIVVNCNKYSKKCCKRLIIDEIKKQCMKGGE